MVCDQRSLAEVCQPTGRLKQKEGFGRITQVISPTLPRKKSCSCPHHCMTNARKNRHEILHPSTARTSGERTGRNQTCMLQHSSSLSCPGLLLKPSLTYLPSPQQPVLECLSPRTCISDEFLSATDEQAQLKEQLAKTSRRKIP